MEELLAKYFSGEVSKDERSLVESWRSESEENAMSFFDAKSVWLDAQPLQPAPKDKLDLILGDEPQGKQVSMWNTNWMKIAVAASIVLVTSLVFIFSSSEPGSRCDEFPFSEPHTLQ